MMRKKLVPLIPRIVAESGARRDAAGKSKLLEASIHDVKIAWGQRVRLRDVLGPVAQQVATRNKRDLNEQVGSVLGIRLELSEPWLTPLINRWTAQNADLIVNVTDTFANRIQRTVRDAVEKGVRASELEDRIADELMDEESIPWMSIEYRARLIARDQVSKLNADITEERQRDIGVERYTWSTSHDDRVRESHKERDGLVFRWDEDIEPQLLDYGLEPDEIDGHPGTPIQCRCSARALFSDVLEGLPEV